MFLVNRDGIIFGAGAVINTAGFLATTSDISNDDFMAGRYNFHIPGRPDASIVNMGTITAHERRLRRAGRAGRAQLRHHHGAISARRARRRQYFTLDFYGDKLITLGVGDQIAGQVKDVATGQTLDVAGHQRRQAEGERRTRRAHRGAARTVVDSVINTSGVIEANSVGTRQGKIVLGAVGHQGRRPAAADRQGVRQARVRKHERQGRQDPVTGENIVLKGATIDASGTHRRRQGADRRRLGRRQRPSGGGLDPEAALEAKAIPNATTVEIDAATTIDASAHLGGDGGKVIVWADSDTTFAGTILARGGSTSATAVSSKCPARAS